MEYCSVTSEETRLGLCPAAINSSPYLLQAHFKDSETKPSNDGRNSLDEGFKVILTNRRWLIHVECCIITPRCSVLCTRRAEIPRPKVRYSPSLLVRTLDAVLHTDCFTLPRGCMEKGLDPGPGGVAHLCTCDSAQIMPLL